MCVSEEKFENELERLLGDCEALLVVADKSPERIGKIIAGMSDVLALAYAVGADGNRRILEELVLSNSDYLVQRSFRAALRLRVMKYKEAA